MDFEEDTDEDADVAPKAVSGDVTFRMDLDRFENLPKERIIMNSLKKMNDSDSKAGFEKHSYSTGVNVEKLFQRRLEAAKEDWQAEMATNKKPNAKGGKGNGKKPAISRAKPPAAKQSKPKARGGSKASSVAVHALGLEVDEVDEADERADIEEESEDKVSNDDSEDSEFLPKEGRKGRTTRAATRRAQAGVSTTRRAAGGIRKSNRVAKVSKYTR